MTDYTDSLIKNITVHTSAKLSSVNLTEKLNQLGESLQYARTSFTSLTSAITSSLTKTQQQQSCSSLPPPAPEQVKGKLDLVIVEARNLNITNALEANIYCLLQYDCNTMSTMDQSPGFQNINNSNKIDILERQIWASSPKWQYAQSL